MKKTLIALAVLGSVAGVAQAQSAVTVYGKLDLGITKLSGDTTTAAKATQMQHNHSSRLGFKGTEDLGGGMSALFQIENRFNADNGTQNGAALFSGPVFVGLASGFGTVKMGRNWSTVDSVSSAAIDPFEGDGIGGLTALTRARINNTITYYSPAMSGFEVQAQYILGEKPAGVATADQNNGYAIGATYNNGPIYLGAGFGREENTDKEDVWGVSGAYTFGPAKIALGYDQYKNKPSGSPKTKNLVVAATYEIGSGLIKAGYNRAKEGDDKLTKVAVGYQHNLSKRTSLYADIARTKETSPGFADTTVNGAGVGITHNF